VALQARLQEQETGSTSDLMLAGPAVCLCTFYLWVLQVPESETIGALKQKIADELKLGDVEEQKLIYLGKILSKNEQTIASVGVKDGGVLVLMISKIKKPAAAAAAPAAAADASSAPAAAAAGPPAAAAAAPAPAAATAAPTPAEQPAPAPAPAVGGAATPPAAAAGSPPAAGAPAPAPAAAGAPASAPAPAVAAESSLAMGAGLEPVVNDLMALGFPRDQVQAALRAAYNNADRAADYLFNGIPVRAVVGKSIVSLQSPRVRSVVPVLTVCFGVQCASLRVSPGSRDAANGAGSPRSGRWRCAAVWCSPGGQRITATATTATG
jgi:UV excision repair protein RAD23